jgi:hypothetical protein
LPFADFHSHAEISQCCHYSRIKIRDRLGPERYLPLRSVASLDTKQMVDKIKVDLKHSFCEGDRRGRESARRHVKRDVPGVIEPRGLRQPNFADDLGPQLKRCAGIPPGLIGKIRPSLSFSFARQHVSLQENV